MNFHNVLNILLLFSTGCDLLVAKEGVRVGEGTFTRELFFESPIKGAIRSIVVLPSDRSKRLNIVICSQLGAAFLTETGDLRGIVHFDDSIQNPGLIDLNRDGAWEYINRGGGWSPVALLNSAGHVRWKYPPERSTPAADAMAAGDLNGDGKWEFVVGMNAGGGLRVLDEEGRELWRKDASNVFSVEVADIDGDGTPEILHSGGQRGILIRDLKEKVVRELQTGFESFSLVRWPKVGCEPCLSGVNSDGVLSVVDMSGKHMREYQLPDNGHNNAQAVSVRFDPRSVPYVAVARTISASYGKSAFYIFDDRGGLVYHQVFPSSYLGLGVLENDDGGEMLLLGSGRKVWSYIPQRGS